MANLYGDLTDEAFKYTGVFKTLTGEDEVFAENKGKDPFTFVNFAKMIFSANKTPSVDDDTFAFWSRWIYIIFPNVFVGEDADNELTEKLTTPQELSGILNLGLKGLKRLLEQKDFSFSKSTQEIQENWIRKSDSVGAFVLDCVEFDPQSEVIKKDVYNDWYLVYCEEEELPSVDDATFGRRMKLHCKGKIKDSRPRFGDKRLTAWKGIKIKGMKMKKDPQQQLK
jgi:putative DNA primase/helicase